MSVLDLFDLEAFQGKDPQQALNGALKQVQSFCGWHIAPSQSDTANVWSTDGCALVLPTMYLTAVASVTQNSTVVAATNYLFESYGVIRTLATGTPFLTAYRATVAFTHGYTALPDDVAQVVLSLAQRSLTDTRGLVARPGTSTGATFIEGYGAQLTDADKEKLGPYRIAGFA